MEKFKKISLKIPINTLIDPRHEFFTQFEKFELIQLHRQADDQIYATLKVKFKNDKLNPNMLKGEQYHISFLEIIKENDLKKEYIIFYKHDLPDDVKKFFKRLDLIIEPPVFLVQDYLFVNIILESKNVDNYYNTLESFFEDGFSILNISNLHTNYKESFLELTDRQKEIIYYAIQQGFFEIPRKINSEEIADHFKISQSTFYEHLRKIDRTIYHSIFS